MFFFLCQGPDVGTVTNANLELHAGEMDDAWKVESVEVTHMGTGQVSAWWQEIMGAGQQAHAPVVQACFPAFMFEPLAAMFNRPAHSAVLLP